MSHTLETIKKQKMFGLFVVRLPLPSICSMQSQAGAYRLVLPTHLTVDNLLSADQWSLSSS